MMEVLKEILEEELQTDLITLNEYHSIPLEICLLIALLRQIKSVRHEMPRSSFSDGE